MTNTDPTDTPDIPDAAATEPADQTNDAAQDPATPDPAPAATPAPDAATLELQDELNSIRALGEDLHG